MSLGIVEEPHHDYFSLLSKYTKHIKEMGLGDRPGFKPKDITQEDWEEAMREEALIT